MNIEHKNFLRGKGIKMYYNIEFVCTGNNGRSPVAEIIAKNILKRESINHIRVNSSGTLVDNIKQLDKSQMTRFLGFLVNEALKYNIINSREAGLLETDPHKLYQILSASETANRERYLKENLPNYQSSERIPMQTSIRSDINLILPISYENLGRVMEIYSKCPLPLEIVELSDFAEYSEKFEKGWGMGYEHYAETADKIKSAATICIKKILDNIKSKYIL